MATTPLRFVARLKRRGLHVHPDGHCPASSDRHLLVALHLPLLPLLPPGCRLIPIEPG